MSLALNFADAWQLFRFVESNLGKVLNEVFFSIGKRYLADDVSLCPELDENRELGMYESFSQMVKTATVIADEMDIVYAKADAEREKFIYAIQSPAWPDHVKIGMTMQTIKARLSSGKVFCRLDPHVVVCSART